MLDPPIARRIQGAIALPAEALLVVGVTLGHRRDVYDR